jgi:hypothetical protein
MRALIGMPKAILAAILATAFALLTIIVHGLYGGRSAQAVSVILVGAGA